MSDKMTSGILGDINPKPGTEDHVASKNDAGRGLHEDENSMVGGTPQLASGHGRYGRGCRQQA